MGPDIQGPFPRTSALHEAGVAGVPSAVAVVSMLQHVLLDWPEQPAPLTRHQGEVLRSVLAEAKEPGWDQFWCQLELQAWGDD